MKKRDIIFLSLLSILIFLALVWGFGWFGVGYTKTVGKAQQNANREVFEQTQSYVEGKRQEALKYYREYLKADEDGKKAIEELVAHSFANMDETKLEEPIQTFVHNCKYKFK